MTDLHIDAAIIKNTDVGKIMNDVHYLSTIDLDGIINIVKSIRGAYITFLPGTDNEDSLINAIIVSWLVENYHDAIPFYVFCKLCTLKSMPLCCNVVFNNTLYTIAVNYEGNRLTRIFKVEDNEYISNIDASVYKHTKILHVGNYTLFCNLKDEDAIFIVNEKEHRLINCVSETVFLDNTFNNKLGNIYGPFESNENIGKQIFTKNELEYIDAQLMLMSLEDADGINHEL